MNRRHICGQDEDGEGAGVSIWMTTQVFNKLPELLERVLTTIFYLKLQIKKN
jgi:hypothetical protein